MITHFFMFILITLLAFFMVPKLYKSLVIDRFNIDNDVHKEIFHADMAIILIFLLNLGVSFASINIYYIMFISAFAIASYALIQFNKTQSAFMTTDGRDSSYKPEAKFQPEGANILGGFYTIWAMIQALGNELPNSDYYIVMPYLLFAAISFFIIFICSLNPYHRGFQTSRGAQKQNYKRC